MNAHFKNNICPVVFFPLSPAYSNVITLGTPHTDVSNLILLWKAFMMQGRGLAAAGKKS